MFTVGIVVLSLVVNIFLGIVLMWSLRDQSYGIWSRKALEIFHPVLMRTGFVFGFFDLDKLHELNDQLGYEEVDTRIAAAMGAAQVRRDCRRFSSNYMFRYYSGDEFAVAMSPNDMRFYIVRLQRAFAAQGLGFTMAIALNLSDARGRVQMIKRAGYRGIIELPVITEITPASVFV